jgi:hypothetical protein
MKQSVYSHNVVAFHHLNSPQGGLLKACAARASIDAAETFRLVIATARAAPARVMATQAVVDVAALDVMNATAGGDGDTGVRASDAKAKVVTAIEVTIRDMG